MRLIASVLGYQCKIMHVGGGGLMLNVRYLQCPADPALCGSGTAASELCVSAEEEASSAPEDF